LKRGNKAKERSQRAVELLGSAIDIKINELTESNRQLKRKIFDLYTIFEISRNFNSVLNHQTLVDSFLLTSIGQMGASSAALYLPPKGDVDFFALVAAKGFSRAAMDGRIRSGGRITTHLTAAAKPVTVAELSEYYADSPESLTFKPFHNGLVIPLIFKSQLKGILLLGAKVSRVGFVTDDIEFLSILANQFVVALENAWLYESEKGAHRDLRIAQKQLVLTERRAAIGELSAKIAHEVNNPLSIISNYLHLCGRNLSNPELANENLDVAKSELSRVARIVRQLLDFYRPQKAEKVPVDIKKTIDDVLALIKWQLDERKILVERLADHPLPIAIGSPEKLKQVFLNIVINAKDFMPLGGKLKIRISGDEDKVKIRFEDTGPGISEEHLPRIFEPFYTTKDDTTGTGLGLSVCYGIINEHGGNIGASNRPDGGARFEITLPATFADKGEAC
jgi:signal transduction histidine kinase